MCRPCGTALLVLPAALLLTGSAAAYSLGENTIRHSDGRYTVAFDMLLDAETARVRELMTDYDHLDRLSAIVTRSRVLAVRPDGSRRIRLDMRACVLFLCKTVRRVQDVETHANGDITTRAVPSLSDFSHAEEHWRIVPQGNGTRIRYDAHMVPDFFVPPILGPWLLQRALRRDLLGAAALLESLAPAVPAPHAR